MSLIQGQQNFIIHFKNDASIEMTSEKRQDIVEIIQQVYWLQILK